MDSGYESDIGESGTILIFVDKTNTKTLCYKFVQSFWIQCLFTGQFNTKDYGTFTDNNNNNNAVV